MMNSSAMNKVQILAAGLRALLTALIMVSAIATSPAGAADEAEPNASVTSLSTQANPMTIVLDARQVSRGIMHAHFSIPAKPGPFTFVYPKWVPGEHGPTGPLGNVAMLAVSSQGQAIPWQRDLVNMYAFKVEVPPGGTTIDVDMDLLMNSADEKHSTANVAVLNWHRVLLYQNNTDSRQVFVRPSIILPAGWDFGTALPDPKRSGDRVDFSEVTLETLVDSPLDMGRYAKHVRLWSNGSATTQLDVFADRPQDLDFAPGLIDKYKRLVPEGLALYGARHWQNYHFLLTLSDVIGSEGIEHHQSSDNRSHDNYMVSADRQLAGGDLLPHEFSHSWNGKYRRPQDLTTANFQIPERTDLMWVYEGLNQYLGDLLSFRSGIRKPELYPEYLASVYANMDTEPGRARDPLIDTAAAAPFLFQENGDYRSLRRSSGDFYAEGELIWLDADTIIRERTHGQKSLDDFLHLYAGPPDSLPEVKTYTRDDIEQLLHEVTPYNWHDFFQHYVYEIAPHPPSDDLARAGWKLVYTDVPNKFDSVSDEQRERITRWYSLGVRLNGAGEISDVRKDSPAWNAGLAPHMEVLAVNEQGFSEEVLDYAIQSARHTVAPIRILVKQGDWFRTYAVSYHGGLRSAHLVRISGTPDMFAQIMRPHAK